MTAVTTNDGVNLHVEDTGGDGQPVVLIHGWPLSAESWSEQINALKAQNYRVIAYDRRGFGRSDKPGGGFDYNTLASDLKAIVDQLDLRDAVLVGFSMGGGEVARYIGTFGTDRLAGAVFAAAVPPFMLQTQGNPDGPLTQDAAQEMEQSVKDDRDGFFEEFSHNFFTAGDELKVSEETRKQTVALAHQSEQAAVLGCMEAFGGTDFRQDLSRVDVPTLIIHGDADGIVPLEGSGQRTHEAIEGSRLEVIEGGPHGINASHPEEFNKALLSFLEGLRK